MRSSVVSDNELDKDQAEHRMTARASEFSVASPLEHLDVSDRHPVGSGLLDQRFHEGEENRQEDKPDEED